MNVSKLAVNIVFFYFWFFFFDSTVAKLTKQYPPTHNFRINSDTDTAERPSPAWMLRAASSYLNASPVGSSPTQLFECESYLFDLASPHCAAVELHCARSTSAPPHGSQRGKDGARARQPQKTHRAVVTWFTNNRRRKKGLVNIKCKLCKFTHTLRRPTNWTGMLINTSVSRGLLFSIF